LVDDASGAPIEQIVVRRERGESLSFRDVRFAPGPGAGSSLKALIDKRNQRILGSS
jgi:hypothetical protein